ncbi:secreted protein [Melampsora americana]|nr:secreted protein [Melampsora americana]
MFVSFTLAQISVFIALPYTSLAAHIPGRADMLLQKRSGKIHVARRDMLAMNWMDPIDEQPRHTHLKRSDASDDPYAPAQMKSDELTTLLSGALSAIPGPDEKQNMEDADDDGKVENHVPGYKAATESLNDQIIDEWAKVIGDCDHNSSVDPTATSACNHPHDKNE